MAGLRRTAMHEWTDHLLSGWPANSYLHSSPLAFRAAMAGFPMWSSERHSHAIDEVIMM
jgi:hypothetical protein